MPTDEASDMSGPNRAGETTGAISSADWARLEPLLDALLDAAPEHRAALLVQLSGGDATRRAELERLLAECEQPSPLLERSVANQFAALLEEDERAMPAALAERYLPIRELGRGGMATVYLARDLKHGRDVAVKVMRPDLASGSGGDRFLREIEIVAQLQHPHIVPLFDSGRAPPSASDNGGLYYVMPCLEGRSLRERLARTGPLSIDEAIAILRDVCEALAYAHERGVVHRDIKPDNVLLSGRHALVSDFGVARAVSAAGAASTFAGVLLGTPAYMAPEQASGDPKVDHRVDIYALGVLAYEVLTGRPPFTGSTPQDIISAHLVETPVPLMARRPDVPVALADLVMRCLAKRPSDRWQSADEVLARLDSLRPAITPRDADDAAAPAAPDRASDAPPPRVSRVSPRLLSYMLAILPAIAVIVVGAMLWSRRSAERALPPRPAPAIAVLVFRHDSDPDLESLSLGLTSSLIRALGSVGRIDVRSLAAVLPLRGERVDSIARRLKVRWLVDGAIVRRSDSVIVSVDLTELPDGRLIASREVGAVSNNDVALLPRLVPAVAAMLRERLGDVVRLEGWRAGTRSEIAFQAVNRAHKAMLDADHLAATRDMNGTWRSLRRADSALATAARADGNWIEPLIQRAWIARKTAFFLLGNGVRGDSIPAALRRGIGHAEAARRITPQEPRALEVHGILLYSQWLIANATAVSDSVRRHSADSLLASAETLLTAATDADSTLPRALETLGAIHHYHGKIEQARLALARAYDADAYAEGAQQVLGNLYAYSFAEGDDADARRRCRAYGETFPADWFAGFCRLELMAWDSTARPNADSAWRIARAAAAAAQEPIRGVAAAQLGVLVAGVLVRVGQADSARRVLDALHSRIDQDPSTITWRHEHELVTLEAGVRVLLGERERAITLLRQNLKSRPHLQALLARDRRFRSLPIDDLVDSPARER
jgi:serine/threonine-protein kinase